MKNRILVTGGTGFIGKALVEKISTLEDMECVVLSRQDKRDFKNVRYCRTDLSKSDNFSTLKDSIGSFDTVIHLMSLIPQASVCHEDLQENIRHNLVATINLLSLVTDKVKSFVYTSTLDVYGLARFLPITESHSTEPLTYYGASKLSSEKFLKIFLKKRGVPLTILRLSQVYGPGELVIKAIPCFIRDILSGNSPVVYGDGEDIRDYVYVDDVISAIIKAFLLKKDGVFNIAGGRGSKIKDILKTIIEISGADVSPMFEPIKKECTNIVFDITKAKETLGWSPDVALENGLIAEYNFFAKHYENIL